MEPYSIFESTLFITSSLIVALSTWAREVMSHAHRNQPETHIPSLSVHKAIELWKDKQTPLSLGLTRYLFGSIAFLALFALVFDKTIISNLVIALILLYALYFVLGLFPQSLAKIRPYRWIKLALIWSNLTRLFFSPWTSLHFKIQETLIRKFGSDPRLAFLTDEELARIASEDSQKEVHAEALDAEERQMIRNIFDWSETPVSEVMTPRGDMICLEIDQSLDEIIQCLNHERLSRIPVYSDNLDNVVGVLHSKDFFHWYSSHRTEGFDFHRLLRPPLSIHRDTCISDLMTEFKRTKTHIAIIIDDYGGTLGLVTLEDLIEEIVGEIYDEDDELESLVKEVRPGIFVADPSISLDDLSETLSRPIQVDEEVDVDTLSGLIQWKLGALPRKGAVMDFQGLRIKILNVQDTRLEKVLIEASPVQLQAEKTK